MDFVGKDDQDMEILCMTWSNRINAFYKRIWTIDLIVPYVFFHMFSLCFEWLVAILQVKYAFTNLISQPCITKGSLCLAVSFLIISFHFTVMYGKPLRSLIWPWLVCYYRIAKGFAWSGHDKLWVNKTWVLTWCLKNTCTCGMVSKESPRVARARERFTRDMLLWLEHNTTSDLVQVWEQQ